MSTSPWRSRLASLTEPAIDGVHSAQAGTALALKSAKAQANRAIHDGRDLARSGLAGSEQLLRQGGVAMSNALATSRSFVARQPLTALAVGLAAGVVLGLAVRQLAAARQDADEPETDGI